MAGCQEEEGQAKVNIKISTQRAKPLMAHHWYECSSVEMKLNKIFHETHIAYTQAFFNDSHHERF